MVPSTQEAHGNVGFSLFLLLTGPIPRGPLLDFPVWRTSVLQLSQNLLGVDFGFEDISIALFCNTLSI